MHFVTDNVPLDTDRTRAAEVLESLGTTGRCGRWRAHQLIAIGGGGEQPQPEQQRRECHQHSPGKRFNIRLLANIQYTDT